MSFSPRTAAFVAGTAIFLATAPANAAMNPHEKPQAIPPGASSGTCMESAAAYAVSTVLQKTGKKNFTDVTGTSVPFTQGTTGCVEVSFSAEAAALPGQIMVTEALVDGTVCLPADNLFASDSPSADLADHAMNYICPNVSAGAHTAKIQFRSRFGGKVALDYHTTIVRYAQ